MHPGTRNRRLKALTFKTEPAEENRNIGPTLGYMRYINHSIKVLNQQLRTVNLTVSIGSFTWMVNWQQMSWLAEHGVRVPCHQRIVYQTVNAELWGVTWRSFKVLNVTICGTLPCPIPTSYAKSIVFPVEFDNTVTWQSNMACYAMV